MARDYVAPQSVSPPNTDVLDAVRRLPAPLRDVVLLRYYADLPIAAVASVLRRPHGTISAACPRRANS